MRIAARKTDPATSHKAAQFMESSGTAASQRAKAAKLVETYPGLTSRELGALSEDLDRYDLARRLPEIEHVLVKRGPERQQPNGRSAATWWPL